MIKKVIPIVKRVIICFVIEMSVSEKLQQFIVQNDIISTIAGFAIGLSAKDTIEAIVYVIIVNPVLSFFKPSNISYNLGYLFKSILTLLSVFAVSFVVLQYGLKQNLLKTSKEEEEEGEKEEETRVKDDIPRPHVPYVM